MLNKRRIFLACTDTPSWDDEDGETCADYRKKYCFDNIAYVYGPLFNYPELNCCGCGKVAKIRGILSKARKYICLQPYFKLDVTLYVPLIVFL